MSTPDTPPPAGNAPTSPAAATDRDMREVSVSVAIEIAAAPEHVFRALTDPRELATWWGSDDTHRARDWELDPRPGGRWRARATDTEGCEGTIGGEYRVVEPPRRLEHTWRASWDASETTVRFELEPVTVDGRPGTRITVTHTTAALGLRAAVVRRTCRAHLRRTTADRRRHARVAPRLLLCL